MFLRSIAAVVLATLGGLNIPVAFGAPQTVAAHVAPAPHNHSCCPGFQPPVAPIVPVPISFSGVPCWARYPCCASQTPSHPSSPAVAAKRVRPRAERSIALTADKLSPGRARILPASAVLFLPPRFEQSAVLRNRVFAFLISAMHFEASLSATQFGARARQQISFQQEKS